MAFSVASGADSEHRSAPSAGKLPATPRRTKKSAGLVAIAMIVIVGAAAVAWFGGLAADLGLRDSSGGEGRAWESLSVNLLSAGSGDELRFSFEVVGFDAEEALIPVREIARLPLIHYSVVDEPLVAPASNHSSWQSCEPYDCSIRGSADQHVYIDWDFTRTWPEIVSGDVWINMSAGNFSTWSAFRDWEPQGPWTGRHNWTWHKAVPVVSIPWGKLSVDVTNDSVVQDSCDSTITLASHECRLLTITITSSHDERARLPDTNWRVIYDPEADPIWLSFVRPAQKSLGPGESTTVVVGIPVFRDDRPPPTLLVGAPRGETDGDAWEFEL